MKKNKLFRAVLLLSCVIAASSSAVHAQTKDAADPVFGVRQVELAGQINLLTERTRTELLAQLRQLRTEKMSVADLSQLVQKAQIWLDAKLPQRFMLSIPAQNLANGVLAVLVQPKLTDLTVTATPDFDSANVLASLPSMVKGKTLENKYWVDLRELQMANENPLKLTTIDYALQPDSGVKAIVKAVAPQGKTQWTVGLSNTGNDIAGRYQTQLNAVNANLTGKDDVLSFAGGGSLSPLFDNAYVAARYTLPDYVEHVSRSLEYTHSKGNVSFPFLSLGTIGSKGTYNDLGFRQSHYLGEVAEFLNSTKLTWGASWISNESEANLSGSRLSQSSIKTVPLSLSLEGELPVDQPNQMRVRVDVLGSTAGLSGSGEGNQWQAARSGADTRYGILRTGFSGRLYAPEDISLSWQYRGQYSAQKLLPVLQFSVINAFTGVRGFVNASGMGDTGHVLRTDLEGSKLWADANLRPYGFVDAGIKKGGSDERRISVASAGLGLRWVSSDRLMRLDTFAANKIKGSNYDMSQDSTTQKNKTTFWFTTSASF